MGIDPQLSKGPLVKHNPHLMWCDVRVWASALQPHTHTITHSHTHPITCTRCCDAIKGTQDQDFSCSFSDSLSLVALQVHIDQNEEVDHHYWLTFVPTMSAEFMERHLMSFMVEISTRGVNRLHPTALGLTMVSRLTARSCSWSSHRSCHHLATASPCQLLPRCYCITPSRQQRHRNTHRDRERHTETEEKIQKDGGPESQRIRLRKR